MRFWTHLTIWASLTAVALIILSTIPAHALKPSQAPDAGALTGNESFVVDRGDGLAIKTTTGRMMNRANHTGTMPASALSGTVAQGNLPAFFTGMVSISPATTTASVSGAYTLPSATTRYVLTLTGATTLTFPTPSAAVSSLGLMLIQGGSGSYTVTWPGVVSWGDAGAPTLSTAVGKKDVVSCGTVDTGASWQCGAVTGY